MSAAPARFTVAGGPTLRQIMLRPRWLAALAVILAVAYGFASLAQWQMSHAIRLDQENYIATETPQPLYELSPPQQPVLELAAGHMVTVVGSLDRASLTLISQRQDISGVGYWVAGRLHTEQDDNLTVALGWAATEEQALAGLTALAQLQPESQLFTGRYNPAEAPRPPQRGEIAAEVFSTLVPGQQLNLWRNPAQKTFPGYLVLDGAHELVSASKLSAIHSPAPQPPQKINWLNLFYAIEWVIFAGFAVYFWVRLCRDAHEKEHELIHLRSSQLLQVAGQQTSETSVAGLQNFGQQGLEQQGSGQFAVNHGAEEPASKERLIQERLIQEHSAAQSTGAQNSEALGFGAPPQQQPEASAEDKI